MSLSARSIRIRPHIYDVRDWNILTETPGQIVFRPSVQTFTRRLGYTLIAGLWIAILSAIHASWFRASSSLTRAQIVEFDRQELEATMDSLRASIPAEEWERIQADTAARNAERQAALNADRKRRQLIDNAVKNIYLAICAAIAAGGLLAPLSVAWQMVTVTIPHRNVIAITARRPWSSQSLISLDSGVSLSVYAAERIARQRGMGIHRLGYRWLVAVEPAPSLAILGSTLRSVELYVHHQKDRPVEQMPLPPRVRTVVDALEGLLGVQAQPLALVDYVRRGGFWGGGRHITSGPGAVKVSRELLGTPTIHTRTFSRDQMPPELRAQIDALRAHSGQPDTATFTVEMVSENGILTYRDAQGNVRAFRSIEEMPEEIRLLFETMKNMPGR